MESMSDPVTARARARCSWPGRITDLAHAEPAVAGAAIGGRERVAMVWRITLDAWALAGLPMPQYDRADMPGRVLRPTAEPGDDDDA
jgi:hypothetical protein